MSNNKKAPAIRFKGFNDDWEERKLGDILQTLPFKAFLKVPEQDGKYEIVQQGNEPIIGYAKGSPCFDYENTVIFGDHTLSLYKPKKPFFVATDGVRIIKGRYNLNGNYLLILLEKYKPQSEGYKRYYSILSDKHCYLISNRSEQTQIGKFFSTLDNLITLQKRKCDKLILLKKAMLEQMFPKGKKSIPEIRFKDFNDDWEERKLGEVGTDIIAGGDIEKNKIKDSGKYPVIANALTNDGIVGYYEEEFRIKAPAVTVTGRGDVGHAKARNINFTPVVRLLSITSNHDVNFLENAINNISVMVESTGVPQLTVPQLEKYKISIPNNPGEEEAIGILFIKFDNLITLQKRKLEKLKIIKKSMLDKMFI